MRLTLAKWLLGPVLLWQGARVRATALRLPEAAGERLQSGGALRLLIVGDSSAAGVGAAHQDEALAGCLARTLAARLARPRHALERAMIAVQEVEVGDRNLLGEAFGLGRRVFTD